MKATKTTLPRDQNTRDLIYYQFRGGESIGSLAKRHGRAESTIRNLLREARVQRITDLPLDYMPSSEFDEPGADDRILAPLPGSDHRPKSRFPVGLPAYLASLYEVPLLTAEQEVHLFRQYNFLKYRASRLREQLVTGRFDRRLIGQIEQLYDSAMAAKNQIIRGNLRLVVSVAKRYMTSADQLFDLISDGNVSLMRAVDRFDYTRGIKFSTYATWAIKNNFAKDVASELKHHARFRTSPDEMLFDKPDHRSDAIQQERSQQLRETQVRKIIRRLDKREREIIRSRFGLTRKKEPKTLKEVGQQLGVSKERIRQLESRALMKLRDAARKEKIEDSIC